MKRLLPIAILMIAGCGVPEKHEEVYTAARIKAIEQRNTELEMRLDYCNQDVLRLEWILDDILQENGDGTSFTVTYEPEEGVMYYHRVAHGDTVTFSRKLSR